MLDAALSAGGGVVAGVPYVGGAVMLGGAGGSCRGSLSGGSICLGGGDWVGGRLMLDRALSAGGRLVGVIALSCGMELVGVFALSCGMELVGVFALSAGRVVVDVWTTVLLWMVRSVVAPLGCADASDPGTARGALRCVRELGFVASGELLVPL